MRKRGEKVKYMAHLLANISCDESISKEVSNQLVRTLESLSYRQIILLALVGTEQQLPDGFHSFPAKKDCLNGYNEISIYQDLFELFQKGLIRDSKSNIIIDVTQINLRETEVVGNGALLYNLTELNNPKRLDSIENIDRMRVILQINNHDIPENLEKYDLLFSEGEIRAEINEKFN